MDNKVQEIIDFCEAIIESGADATDLSGRSVGHSERVIETPWVASILAQCEGAKLLDVGFTMASLDYMGALLLLQARRGIEINALDIVQPERVKNRYPEEWRETVMSVPISISDVREFRTEEKYDLVTCISTIEHVGFDAATYDDPASAFVRCEALDDVKMLREVDTDKRVLDTFSALLKPGGRVLLSVPVGQGKPVLLRDSLGLYCAQWEYDSESWRELVSHPDFVVEEQSYYGLAENGLWEPADNLDLLRNYTGELQEHARACATLVLKKVDRSND